MTFYPRHPLYSTFLFCCILELVCLKWPVLFHTLPTYLVLLSILWLYAEITMYTAKQSALKWLYALNKYSKSLPLFSRKEVFKILSIRLIISDFRPQSHETKDWLPTTTTSHKGKMCVPQLVGEWFAGGCCEVDSKCLSHTKPWDLSVTNGCHHWLQRKSVQSVLHWLEVDVNPSLGLCDCSLNWTPFT